MPLVALLLACLATALPAAQGESVDRLLATVPAGGEVAVVVYDTTRRQLTYSRNGSLQLVPASVAKLLVSAAALLELGPDWTFKTRLTALGPLHNGVIPGLGIDANGDPCLDEHHSEGDPERFFRSWASRLAAAGVRRIDGDLVVDRSRFSGPSKPASWPQDHANQQSWFSAPSSAFAWNDNCLRIRIIPGDVGRPCTVDVQPRSPRVPVTNKTTTAAKAANNVIANRERYGNATTVSGTYSRRSEWLDLALHDEADLAAADHLKMVIERSGIPISGKVVAGKVPHDSRELVLETHTMGQALDILNQRSINFYGEQIIRTLGWLKFQEGSTDAGTRAVGQILRHHLGADLAGWTLADGSGLSYDNRACADLLARLLVFMDAHPLGERYRATLKPMDHGTAHGLVKTGTLAIARGLAGYLDHGDGRRSCFVILINKGEARTSGWMVGLREKLFAAIAESL